MYVKILENRLFVIVVKCISTNGKSILLLVIVLGVMIIEKWFYKKMIRYKLIIVSLSGYTNEGICLI
jgi:O-antigen ligase